MIDHPVTQAAKLSDLMNAAICLLNEGGPAIPLAVTVLTVAEEMAEALTSHLDRTEL